MNEKSALIENTKAPFQDYQKVTDNFHSALRLIDDLVLKNYVSKLQDRSILPLSEGLKSNFDKHVRFFKITQMVYRKDEYSAFKLASVFNSLPTAKCAVFVLMDSDGNKTDFYLGINEYDERTPVSSLIDTLDGALKGQFPGTKTLNMDSDEMKNLKEEIGQKSKNVSIVTCVADSKDDDNRKNESFIQGLEKLALAMQGKKYTGLVLANGTTQEELWKLREQYETIYTQLSPFAKLQSSWAHSMGESSSRSIGVGISTTDSIGKSWSASTSVSQSRSESTSKSINSPSTAQKIIAGVGIASTALAGILGGMPAILGAGVVSDDLPKFFSSSISNGTSSSVSQSTSKSDTHGENESHSRGNTRTSTDTEGRTTGDTNSILLTVENKKISNILKRIEKQLERLDEFESLGMWNCAAYFLSEEPADAEIAASTYKAIMRGQDSGVETSAINSWTGNGKSKEVNLLKEYLLNMLPPVFNFGNEKNQIPVTPCAMVSGNELALHMGLPRKSVAGFPVIEHADFGREVVRTSAEQEHSYGIPLGDIFNMGSAYENLPVKLNDQSLTMHTFVTGATGSGKSTAIYRLLDQISSLKIEDRDDMVHFMVIEPAKGEYKNRFGSFRNVSVYGTNSKKTPLLRIDPFSFPDDVHVLEHIDRLVEIFNVCWPMYAAMPAVLKDAVEQSYRDAGWDLNCSECRYHDSEGHPLFPTFADVLREVNLVMDRSLYSGDTMGDYKGALCTRLKSLTNGLYRQIFTNNELSGKELFDENVIVDLSRVGSSETKSLLMGLLVMKLQEYRMAHACGGNAKLQHVTILEEAHHLLKRTGQVSDGEGSNMLGKSVEMLSNSIAEMRTYGEGFIIADQSPGLMDPSVIRNTNTKIILRLPDFEDRELVGKAAGLNEEQISELAKLPTFVAAVYQNDWLEPVLCRITTDFSQKIRPYEYEQSGQDENKVDISYIKYILNPLSMRRILTSEYLYKRFRNRVFQFPLPASTKVLLLRAIGDKEGKLAKVLRGKMLYDFFNSDYAFADAHMAETDVDKWERLFMDRLEPDLEELELTDPEKTQVISTLVREHVDREQSVEAKNLYKNYVTFVTERSK
ncbi:ATP-binding protein [Dialister sp.]|uniref:ATP-binding protein n=1 Tax=Dialister sp. TaxID=1955814 RepID=UPI002E804A4A|nr:DUF87 domain-containing protein [Dialister sp.]MEE3452837.1 DUF87 domain-containing protein [Dialister sp.]